MSDMKLPRPSARDEFRKRLRADLVNEAVRLAEARRRRTFGQRLVGWWSAGPLRPIAVTVALLVMLVAGTGVAAAGSLPGDPTYGLKRAAEQVELAFALTAEAKVEVLGAQAQRRLDELSQVAERSDKAPTASDEYDAAVERFGAAVDALRAAEPEDKRGLVDELVDAARAKHVPVLEELRDRVPAPAQKGIDRALEEHRRLAPGGKPSQAPGKPSERPGNGPKKDAEATPALTPTPTPSPTDTPLPTETPRGGRPSSVPPARP